MSTPLPNRPVWCFGSRWHETGLAGTSILRSVFLKHGIVFARTARCMRMREGDLLAIADGHEVIAIAKALSPPACITRFDLPDEVNEWVDVSDGAIHGCRADIILLEEEDSFTYPRRRRFCRAWLHGARVNELWAKYHSESPAAEAVAQPNIFQWATKELSQDAFLCWLIHWASVENALANPCMHELGRRFVERLLAQRFTGLELPENSVVEVFRQVACIDIAVKITPPQGKPYALLIEDKVDASLHNDLAGYLQRLLDDAHFLDCPKTHFCSLFIKTRDESLCEIEHMLSAGESKPFLRQDFLAFFAENASLCQHALVRDFLERLRGFDAEANAWMSLPVKEWGERGRAWQGFYTYLSHHSPLRSWFVVNNASGGFLAARSEFLWDICEQFPGCDCIYWQIESDKQLLCLKIGVSERPSEVRNQVHNAVGEYLKRHGNQNAMCRPARFGTGQYMTIIVVKPEDWLLRSDGGVDPQAVVERLKFYDLLLREMVADIRQSPPSADS